MCDAGCLAYTEMRLILARFVYEFDMVLADESQMWLERQKAFTIWDRLPLNVFFVPVKRGRFKSRVFSVFT